MACAPGDGDGEKTYAPTGFQKKKKAERIRTCEKYSVNESNKIAGFLPQNSSTLERPVKIFLNG
jgi:hypothetical protein